MKRHTPIHLISLLVLCLFLGFQGEILAQPAPSSPPDKIGIIFSNVDEEGTVLINYANLREPTQFLKMGGKIRLTNLQVVTIGYTSATEILFVQNTKTKVTTKIELGRTAWFTQ